MDPRPVRHPGLYLAALAAIAAAFAYLAFENRWFSDDSFVALRQAWHVAEGHGFVWNTGGPPHDATGRPLWTLLATLSLMTGLDPVLFAWYCGALCGMAVLVLLFFAARDLFGMPPAWALVPPALLAAQRPFLVGAMGADGTRLATLLLLAGTLLLAREQERRPPGWRGSGFVFFAATLAYPLAPLLHAAAAAGLGLARPERARLSALGRSLALHAGLLVGLALVRGAYFGAALPPGIAGPRLDDGLRYLAQFPLHTEGWLWVPLLLGGLLVLGRRLPDLAAALLVQGIVLCATVGLAGAPPREFLPLDALLPAFALLLAAAVRGILLLRGEDPSTRRGAVLAIVVLGLLASQASTAFRSFDPAAPVQTREQLHEAARAALAEGQALAPHLAPTDRIATSSRGAVPYITRAWHAPFGSWQGALRDGVTFVAVFGSFLFERPHPPAAVPAAPLPSGTPLYCLQLPEAREAYWVFASPRPPDEIRAFARERGLTFVYAETWSAAAGEGEPRIGSPR